MTSQRWVRSWMCDSDADEVCRAAVDLVAVLATMWSEVGTDQRENAGTVRWAVSSFGSVSKTVTEFISSMGAAGVRAPKWIVPGYDLEPSFAAHRCATPTIASCKSCGSAVRLEKWCDPGGAGAVWSGRRRETRDVATHAQQEFASHMPAMRLPISVYSVKNGGLPQCSPQWFETACPMASVVH